MASPREPKPKKRSPPHRKRARTSPPKAPKPGPASGVAEKAGSVALWVFRGAGPVPDPQRFTGGFDGDDGEEAGGVVAPLDRQLQGSSYVDSFLAVAVAKAKGLGVADAVRALFLLYDYAGTSKAGPVAGYRGLTFVGNFHFARRSPPHP